MRVHCHLQIEETGIIGEGCIRSGYRDFLEGTLFGFSRAQRRRRPDSVLPRDIILLSMHVHRKRGTLRGSMALTHNNNNKNNKQRYHR